MENGKSVNKLREAEELLILAKDQYKESLELVNEAFTLVTSTPPDLSGDTFTERAAIKHHGLAIREIVLLLEQMEANGLIERLDKSKEHIGHTGSLTFSTEVEAA